EFEVNSLDAFNDWLTDVDVPTEGGLALVFRRFDLLRRNAKEFTSQLVSILADATYGNLLYGRRFLSLVQSDDPKEELKTFEGRPIPWNSREHFLKSRGLETVRPSN